jgi:HK97 family phage major capsid protein
MSYETYRKIELAELEIEDLKQKSGWYEVQEQRKNLVPVFPGQHNKGATRRLELGDDDVKFLSYVRGKVGPEAIKALVEDSTGRQLISPAIDAELHRAIGELVTVRQLATVKTTEKDRILVRSIDEASVAYGKLETGAAIPEGTPTPAETTKYIEDVNGLVKIGIDQLEDSDHDLAAYLVDSFSRAVSNLENAKFLYGGGHDYEEPEGICTNATLLADAVDTTAAGAVTIEDCLNTIYSVPAQYRKGSSWVVNSLTELELRKLRAESTSGIHEGAFLWQPSVIAGAPNQFLGYPIHTDDNLGTLAGTEEILAIFGNFKLGYTIYDRKRITIDIMREIYREAGLQGHILRTRNTGFPIRPADKRLVLLKEHA